MATDVLFIHPGYQKNTYQDLSREFTAIDVPVWAALLANHVRNKGFDCAIHDVNVQGWNDSILKDILNHSDPKLIVMMVYGHQPSASTQTMPAARKIACDLKAHDKHLLLAMGGTHPSALPERTMKEEAVDYIISGEGTDTIVGLIKHLRGECRLTDVPGLWYKQDGTPEFTGKADPIEDLDNELAGYAWDLLPDLGHYRAHTWHCFEYFKNSAETTFADVRTPYVSIYTSLGCPFSCHFCCVNAIFGKAGVRYWSVERVVDWLGELVEKHGVKNVRFADELFVLSPKRVKRFCDLMIDRGYDMNIWAYARVDTISEKLLSKMKRAGINWLCLGIESGNPCVREDVSKPINKDIARIVQQIRDAGIYIMGNYMFGLPEDSLETMQQTLDLAMSLNCDFVNFYVTMAYPGSELYKDALKKDLIPDKWVAYSQHNYDTQPLPTRFLSPKEVMKFRDEAFNTYFNNTKYLDMIERKFGTKTRKHIEKMLQLGIERRLTSANSDSNS
ncbi:B12-binding domain-containing radical SAM protein [Verrucomicrobiota bacterium]